MIRVGIAIRFRKRTEAWAMAAMPARPTTAKMRYFANSVKASWP